MKHYLWRIMGPEGWENRRLFTVNDDGVVVEGAPGNILAIHRGMFERAKISSKEYPDHYALDLIDDADALAVGLELRMKSAQEAASAYAAGSYLGLHADSLTDQEIPVEEAAYVRILRDLGERDLLVKLLGIHRIPMGDLQAEIWEYPELRKIEKANDLILGKDYILKRDSGLEIEKSSVKDRRKDPDWEHFPDDDLDMRRSRRPYPKRK